MESSREKQGDVGNKRQIEDQLGKDTCNPFNDNVGVKPQGEDLRLEPYIEQGEKEIRSTKKTACSSNRRRKVRIYLPS